MVTALRWFTPQSQSHSLKNGRHMPCARTHAIVYGQSRRTDPGLPEFGNLGRVESWRSSEGPISSSPSSNRACDFLAHGFPIIFGQRLSLLSLALWYSLLQSSRTLPEFIACAISCPSLLQKYDESIAPSLSQSFAALRSKRYYGQLRLPNRPKGISFPYILPLLSSTAPTRVSRATPPDFSCVSPLLPRKPTNPFWQFSLRPVSQPSPNVHRVGNSFL